MDEQEAITDADGVIRKRGLFENLDGEQTVNELESYCVNCEENGTTRLLLTKIPHFREVIIMAFECPHCGFKNNEIQTGAAVAEKGVKHILTVNDQADLNRQLVRSERCQVIFPQLDLTISPSSGSLTTVEGCIEKAIEELRQDQPTRLSESYEMWSKVQNVITSLEGYLANKETFELVLDDASGNSYIENLCAPNADPKIVVRTYWRTKEQDEALGLTLHEAPQGQEGVEQTTTEPTVYDVLGHQLKPHSVETDDNDLGLDLAHQVHTFHGNCSRCSVPCDTQMHMLDIPHFKEVIIMSTKCDECGYKNNEVKAGGAVAPKGKRITLKVSEKDDFSRDILKSESCGLTVPEIDLRLEAGTLGGRFTTVEGLLQQIFEELDEKSPFRRGDSVDETRKKAFESFLTKLQALLNFTHPFTLILDDPLANSYLQNPYAPDPDPNMTIEEYERTFEENEDWGLNDMKVENYS